MVDDSKLPLDNTLNSTTRGRTADTYYRSHHGIDTVIGHSLGGAVSLALESNIKNKMETHMVLFNLKHLVAQLYQVTYQTHYIKNIVKDEIVGAGVAGGLAIGASADAAIGFSDGGILSGLGTDIGNEYHLILLIGLHQILIQPLMGFVILEIRSLCLTLTVRLCSQVLNSVGIIVHIHIQV